MTKKGILGIVCGSIILAGCAGTTPDLGKIGKSGNYESVEKTGGYQQLSKNLVKKQKDDLLWYLDAGLISRYAQDYNQSIFFFNKSEVKIKKFDKEVLAGKMFANIGAVLTNDTFMDYRPRIYEGIMVNTYKGMDYLSEGKISSARVEFNRAIERQRRAKKFFQSEISQEKQKIKEENKKKLKGKKVSQKRVEESANNQKTKNAIEKKYTNLFAFKPYPDFVNPFASYMAGLFSIRAHDYQKATNLLKETYGMIKGNEAGANYVENDWKFAFKYAGTLNHKSNKHYAWIIFANGRGPSKKELRFDIPLFLVTKSIYYTGIALPTFKENPAAFSYLNIQNANKSVSTKEIASMDKIIKTEFKKRFPTIMARAITRTVTQSLIQYELKRRGGLLGGIIGAAYQGFMNRADTRQWLLLPKNFQIARIRIKSSKLSVFTPNHTKVFTMNLNPKKNHIVFIRITTPTSKAIYNEVSF